MALASPHVGTIFRVPPFHPETNNPKRNHNTPVGPSSLFLLATWPCRSRPKNEKGKAVPGLPRLQGQGGEAAGAGGGEGAQGAGRCRVSKVLSEGGGKVIDRSTASRETSETFI